MNFYLGFSVLVFFGLSLGCSTTFSLNVPKNELNAYIGCLKLRGGKCPEVNSKEKCKATDTEIAKKILEDSSTEESSSEFTAICTAPKFENPFSDDSNKKQSDVMDMMGLKGELRQEKFDKLKKMLKQPVDDALKVMNSPVRGKFDDIYNAIADPRSKVNLVEIQVKELTDFSEALARVTAANGWEAYRIAAMVNYSLKQDEETRKDVNTANLLEAYTKAYFRNGEFVSVSIELPTLIKPFPSMEKYRPEVKVKEEIDNGLKEAQEKLVVGRIGDAGFVTRFGTKYQFPPIQLKLDPAASSVLTFSKVDYVQIGNDLIRVFIEALFDGVDALPGLIESTGVKVRLKKMFPESKPDEEKGLPEFKPDEGDYKCVSKEDFTQMNQTANEVESGVSFIVSKLIRGGGPLSINNEAVETLIENSIGILSRKVFEKIVWCWYSCGFPEVFNGMVEGPLGEMKTIEIKVYY